MRRAADLIRGRLLICVEIFKVWIVVGCFLLSFDALALDFGES